jgi:hypothetical protein
MTMERNAPAQQGGGFSGCPSFAALQEVSGRLAGYFW